MTRKIICVMLALLAFMPAFSKNEWRHPWQGRRVAYLGDSITDPNNDGSKLKYWNYLQQLLGITPYVYGISGCQWNAIPGQANKLKAEHGNDFDAIMIFIGTNDYNDGVPIGQWYTESRKQVVAGIHEPKHLVDRIQRHICMTDSTYRGRINVALSTVKRMFPDKQIVLLTPIHRAGFYANDKNWQPTEDYQNRCGEYLDAYVNSVKEAGNIWAVPVIDLNSVCGLYPMMDEYVQYFHTGDTDRLHPNDKGHERIARTLVYQLLTLPCTFTN